MVDSGPAGTNPGAQTYRRPDRRVALITGGGAGAGAAIARAYAAIGVRVVVSDIDFTLAGAVAAQIRDRGGQALAHRCDVASEEQVAGLVTRAEKEFGALNFVINNAGPYLVDEPLEHWQRLVGGNLLGTLHVTRHAIAAMGERGGSIVNVGAAGALGFGPADSPAYAAAKAAIVHLSSALGFLANQGIRVNCVVPDWIATDYRLQWLQSLSAAERDRLQIPSVMMAPEQFAAAVVKVSQREDLAGRVVLCRAGEPLQLIARADPGYRETEPF